jgi:ParB/RepB/Spo0J family partition protein
MHMKITPKKKAAPATVTASSSSQSTKTSSAPDRGKQSPLSAAFENLEDYKKKAAARAGVPPDKLTSLSKREASDLVSGAGFQRVLTIDIGRSPFNREHFDQKALKELTEDVAERGILQPLIVRKNPGYSCWGNDGTFLVRSSGGTVVAKGLSKFDAEQLALKYCKPKWEIIAGERRWRAASGCKLRECPVIVIVADDKKAIEDQAVENIQREDLNPIHEAEKYQQLLEQYTREGFNDTDAMELLVEKMQRSKSLIYERMKLLKLPEIAREAALEGRLPASHAAQISKIPDLAAAEAVTLQVLKADQYDRIDEDEEDVSGLTLAQRATLMSYRSTKDLVNETIAIVETRRKTEELANEFRKKGLEVLSIEQARKIFRDEHSLELTEKSGFVRVDGSCRADSQWRAWKAVLGKKAPAEILAEHPKRGTAVILYREEQARAALPKESVTKRKSSRPESEVKMEREHKERSNVFAGLLVTAAKAGESNDSPEVWSFLFREVMSMGVADPLWRVAKRRFPDIKRDVMYTEIEKRMKSASGKILRGFVLEVLFARYSPNLYGGGWGDGFGEACKFFGVKAPAWKVQTSGKDAAK